MPDTEVLAAKLEMLHGDVVDVKTALARLSDAITKLALVEERQAQTTESLHRAFNLVSKIEERVSALEKVAPKNKETSIWVDRFILGIVVMVVSFVATKVGLQ